MNLVIFVLNRAKEASSYAGLAALLQAAHLCSDCTTMAQYATSLCIGAAGLAAIFIPEKAK